MCLLQFFLNKLNYVHNFNYVFKIYALLFIKTQTNNRRFQSIYVTVKVQKTIQVILYKKVFSITLDVSDDIYPG